MVFWAKRLKADIDASTWAVPFSDMMSLLLAVFVLVAAMSELGPGRRFDKVGHSVKSAFGFQSAIVGEGSGSQSRSIDPLERLAAGLSTAATVQFCDPSDVLLPACEIISEADRLIIRVTAGDAFFGPSAVPSPRTRKLIAAIADHLREGQARLEVRGYGPVGTLSPGLPYQDELDVACERARVVSRELARGGVAENRISAATFADPADGRGFDIVVYASLPAAHRRDRKERADVNHG